MSLRIVKSGLLTTVQDLGRSGFQKFGIIASGAMDPFALKAANLMVGNVMGEAGLEVTVMGDTIAFETDAVISICGGDLSPEIEGIAVPQWRSVLVRGGSTLAFGSAKGRGCRTYLAVGGGFDIPPELQSRSTYLRAGLGGYQGRALKKGDVIGIRSASDTTRRIMSRLSSINSKDSFTASPLAVFRHILPEYNANPVIRVIRGGEFELFDLQSQRKLFESAFRVQPQSDRMGYRLSTNGGSLRLQEKQEMISEVVTFGTIQVPSDGNPIVLMADRQTTGGYPKIAQVISADLPLMGQLLPGAQIQFQEVTLEEAQRLFWIQEMELRMLQQGIFINSFT